MKLFSKIKNWFKKEEKYVRVEKLREILDETGLRKTRNLFDLDMGYIFGGGKKPSNYNNVIDEINFVNSKLNRVIEYLGIEEKRESEKVYYKEKKKKRAKKSR